MRRNARIERRLYPRIQKTLPFNVTANGYDFSTSTENISCVGAYCHVAKYIPPFTKVAIKIRLPKEIVQRTVPSDIECKGVIVRTEDADDGGFNIAIFFNEIKESQRLVISRYISGFLSKPPQPS